MPSQFSSLAFVDLRLEEKSSWLAGFPGEPDLMPALKS